MTRPVRNVANTPTAEAQVKALFIRFNGVQDGGSTVQTKAPNAGQC